MQWKAMKEDCLRQGLCPRCWGKRLLVVGKKACEDCLERARSYAKTSTAKENSTKARKKYNKRIKERTLEEYGGAFCKCCGESCIEMLTIDHIAENGAQHRAEIGFQSGIGMYGWLERNNFPEGYQVLCFNCNISKHRFGKCSHVAGLAILARNLVKLYEQVIAAGPISDLSGIVRPGIGGSDGVANRREAPGVKVESA